jgi:uncharacterized RDD family membrane protein YckC
MGADPLNQDSHFEAALDVTLELPLASLGTRGLANAVDLLLVFLLQIALFLAGMMLAVAIPKEAVVYVVVLGLVTAFALQWGFFATCERLMDGQTPGKRLLGLRVVTDDGGAVGWTACLLRNLLRPVDFFPAAYGVGLVCQFLLPRSKRLGDLAAGTVVVCEHTREWDLPPPRCPAGFSGDDVALVEAYFYRQHGLLPERRAALAADLMRWLERSHPDFAAQAPDDAHPEYAVAQLFYPPDDGAP